MITETAPTTDRLSTELLRYLTGHSSPYSISIFLPTRKTGKEVQDQLALQALKAELRSIRHALNEEGVKEIDAHLAPFSSLLSDTDFWRNQELGLALFCSDAKLTVIQLPYSVMQQHRLSPEFYLLPLAPLISHNTAFYVLAIELGNIRLFMGNRDRLIEINISDMIPGKLEDRVGYEFTGKDLQFRNQHQAYSGAGYHGHDEADRDRKNEILRYFREVDNGLQSVLNREPLPMVIASQDYLAAIYKEASRYDLLQPEVIICNLSESTTTELHHLAVTKLKSVFEREAIEKWGAFLQLQGSGKASTIPSEIFEAIRLGKVDSLFVNPQRDIRGSYNSRTGVLKHENRITEFTSSLVSLAIAKTLNQKGKVYVLDNDVFPMPSDTMAALFRF